MRKQLQIDTGKGWCNLSSEFYGSGDQKAEALAQRKMEQAMSGWPLRYEPFRNAQFRIIDSLN